MAMAPTARQQAWPAVLLCAVMALAATARASPLCVLHFSDLHGRVEPFDEDLRTCDALDAGGCSGGYARLATGIREVRESPGCECNVVLDAGDHLMGTLWTTVFRGFAEAELLKFFSVSAMTLGNHEFDYGPVAAAEFVGNITEAGIPVVVSNIETRPASPMSGLLRTWAVVDDGCGREVGIVGWVIRTTAYTSSPGEGITFTEPVAAVTAAIAEMKGEHPGVNIVIGISHSGLSELDVNFDEEGDLAIGPRLPSEIDLIVGGHSHTFQYTFSPDEVVPAFPVKSGGFNTDTVADEPIPPYPTMVSRPGLTVDGSDSGLGGSGAELPVVHDFWGGRYLGVLKLEVSEGGVVTSATGNPMLLGSDGSTNPVALDPTVADRIADLKKTFDSFLTHPVGSSLEELPGEPRGGPEGTRTRENRLCNLIADAMVWGSNQYYAQYLLQEKVEIGILNGGAVRVDLPRGVVIYRDILEIIPFGNLIDVKRVTGEQLLSALHNGVSLMNPEDPSGRFLQVSGIHYKFDDNGTVYDVHVSVGGVLTPLEPDRQYLVAMPDYLGVGGDEYEQLAAAPYVQPKGFGNPMELALVEYLAVFGTIDRSIEGRVVHCEKFPGDAAPCLPMTTGDAPTSGAAGRGAAGGGVAATAAAAAAAVLAAAAGAGVSLL